MKKEGGSSRTRGGGQQKNRLKESDEKGQESRDIQ